MFKCAFHAIRHGQTAWNVEGRFQGLTDVPLSDEGRARALAGCARLAEIFAADRGATAPRRILSSPLRRASETAEILCASLGLPGSALGSDERLAEVGFGAWEGLTTLEVKERFPEERRRRKAERWSFAPPGGRSYDDLAPGLEALLGELEGGPPAILVTHTGNLRILMTLAGGVSRATAARAPVPQDALFHFAAGRMSCL